MRDPETDAELLQRSSVDPYAYGTFLGRHLVPVLGAATLAVDDAVAAIDLTGETFATTLRGAECFRSEHSARGWLFGVAFRIADRAAVDRRVPDTERHGLGLAAILVDTRADALPQLRAARRLAGTPDRLVEDLSDDQRDASLVPIEHRHRPPLADVVLSSSVIRTAEPALWPGPFETLEHHLVAAAGRRAVRRTPRSPGRRLAAFLVGLRL